MGPISATSFWAVYSIFFLLLLEVGSGTVAHATCVQFYEWGIKLLAVLLITKPIGNQQLRRKTLRDFDVVRN